MTSTPGPWRVHTFTPKGWSTQTTTILGPDDVAIVGGVHWGSADGSVGQANARLIAAAPDLLSACGSAAWVFTNLHNVREDPDQFIEYAQAAFEDIRNAIAKVSGVEP